MSFHRHGRYDRCDLSLCAVLHEISQTWLTHLSVDCKFYNELLRQCDLLYDSKGPTAILKFSYKNNKENQAAQNYEQILYDYSDHVPIETPFDTYNTETITVDV